AQPPSPPADAPPAETKEDRAANPPGWRWRNPLPQGNTLRGVWGDASGGVYAVGDDGTILHTPDGGTTWSLQLCCATTLNALSSSGTETEYAAYHAVWGTAGGIVYVAGQGGALLYSADKGASWRPLQSGLTQDLYGIWGSARAGIYVVGGYGTILHSED